MEEPIYTKADEGCYGDGAGGHAHVRARLAELVRPFNQDLAEELRSEDWSDDLSEEDDALEILGEHSAPGMVWEIEDGDLILRYDPENDPGILTFEAFPEWAVPALEYGIESLKMGEDRRLFRAWAERELGDKAFTYSTKEGEDAGFSWNPEFGPACNVVTVYIRIIEPAEPERDLFTGQE